MVFCHSSPNGLKHPLPPQSNDGNLEASRWNRKATILTYLCGRAEYKWGSAIQKLLKWHFYYLKSERSKLYKSFSNSDIVIFFYYYKKPILSYSLDSENNRYSPYFSGFKYLDTLYCLSFQFANKPVLTV